jgi:ELWxxDGT repeat protein
MRHVYAITSLLVLCCTLLQIFPVHAVPHQMAASPTLVKNVNMAMRDDLQKYGGGAVPFVSGNMVYFVDYDAEHGYELRVSDGTPGNARLVRDMIPGPEDGQFGGMIDLDGTLFFIAAYQLWKTDGSAEGTQIVNNGQTGQPVYASAILSASDTLVYFTSGRELWRTDGTSTGNELLHTWNGGFGQIGGAVAMNNMMYFSLTQNNQTELWKTDGTSAGTILVKLLDTGTTTMIGDPTVVGDKLYFMFNDDLWRSDGTAAGTQIIPGEYNSLYYSNQDPIGTLESYNGSLYVGYVAEIPVPGNPPERHMTLARLANTSTTPVVVYDFGINGVLKRFISLADKLYFTGPGDRIWRSNGITTEPVPATGASTGYLYHDTSMLIAVSRMVALNNGTVILRATADLSVSPRLYDLWAISATDGIARQIQTFAADAGPTEGSLASLGNLAFFAAGAYQRVLLWKTDGTQNGTIPMTTRSVEAGIDGEQVGYTNLEQVVLGDQVIFNALGENGLYRLWASNGTEAGTTQIFNGSARSLRVWNDKAYFIGSTHSMYGIWQTDGTADGTIPIKQILWPDIVVWLINTPDGLYFVAGTRSEQNIRADFKLWKSDGTAAGTTVVTPLPSWNDPYDHAIPGTPEIVGNRFYFTAVEQATGRELWVSDGTAAGTRLVKDITPGSYQSIPYGSDLIGLTAVGDRLFFLEGSTLMFGSKLWVSNGTEAGTTLVKNLGPVPQPLESPVLGQMIDLNDQAFFSGWDTEAWVEPWMSGGTPETTRRVKDINTLPRTASAGSFIGSITAPSFPNDMVVLNSKVLFRADDGVHGAELWLSDGTEAGTTMLIDLNPGTFGSAPSGLVNVGGYVLFAASSGPDGVELWRTYGTAAGTVRLADVAVGPGSSNPANIRLVGNKVFFQANDGIIGRELHAVDLIPMTYQAFLPGLVR